MTDENKIFNTRTNRYVTKGSTAYRRMVCEDNKEKVKKEAELKKLNLSTEKKEVEKEKSKSKSKSLPKEKVRKMPDENAINKLTSMSMKIIKDNDDKFRKIRGEQDETDKLLKKLLYEKLAKKPKEVKKIPKNHRSEKKSRPKSLFEDFDSLSFSDSDSSFSSL